MDDEPPLQLVLINAMTAVNNNSVRKKEAPDQGISKVSDLFRVAIIMRIWPTP